jgi:hypothetical protein
MRRKSVFFTKVLIDGLIVVRFAGAAAGNTLADFLNRRNLPVWGCHRCKRHPLRAIRVQVRHYFRHTVVDDVLLRAFVQLERIYFPLVMRVLSFRVRIVMRTRRLSVTRRSYCCFCSLKNLRTFAKARCDSFDGLSLSHAQQVETHRE